GGAGQDGGPRRDARPRRARHQGRRHRLRVHRGPRVGADAARGEDRRADRGGRRRAAAAGGARGEVAGVLPGADAVAGGPTADKLALLRISDKAARAHDPRIVKVEASFTEAIKEILVVTSDGKMASDVQPMVRFGVRAVA